MKPLFLLVGKSASGKTAVAKFLEREYGMSQIQSYTTRLPRHENETGHTFVSNDEFDKLIDIVAYTEYDGNRYCCTRDQIDKADIYVIDPIGVSSLMYNYNTDRDMHIFFFSADIDKRILRMKNRGDSSEAVLQRIENDNEYNWWDVINKVVQENSHVRLHKINANLSKDEMFEVIVDIIDNF